MKLKVRVVIFIFIIFIFYVSFKILEPEIKDSPVETKDPDDALLPPEKPHFDNGKGSVIRTKKHNQTTVALIEWFLKRYKIDWNYKLKGSPWKLAASWVGSRQIHPDHTPEMGAIMKKMNEAKVISADVGHRGTQLKMTLVLEGGQRVAFKPRWYARDYVVTGEPYAGGDRHNGEIAAFTLNRILGFHRSPLVTGRVIDLEKEIMPVGSPRLLKTFFKKNGNRCFYGKCLYCKSEADGVCAEGNLLEGAVVLWLPSQWKFQMHKHPWSRTYRAHQKAAWESYDEYCTAVRTMPAFSSGPRLLDVIDASVFDYLIGNADRHHYETFKDFNDSMLVMLDSAKSFGNPHWDERTILAPVYQCCLIRRKTWERLQLMRDGVLSTVMREILSYEPIAPILTDPHYEAMDRRLEFILDILEDCMQKYTTDRVLVRDKYSEQTT